MRVEKRFRRVVLAVLLFVFLTSCPVVHAAIIESHSFDPGIGKLVYSFTIDNTAESVFEVTSWYLDLSGVTPDWTAADITVPTDWTVNPPSGTQDFWTFSSIFGSFGFPSNPVLPGQALGGFEIPSIFAPATMSYSETLVYTDPVTFISTIGSRTGTTLGPGGPPIPEPGTLMLLASGLAPIFVLLRRKSRKAS